MHNENDTAKKSTLLVIDVQMIAFEPAPVYKAKAVLKNIKNIISCYRRQHLPIIFVQHDGKAHEAYGVEKPGWFLHPDIFPVDDEPLIHKHFPDAFQETNLDSTLKKQGVDNIVVVGMQTEYCIDTTCRQAFRLGYQVTLIEDAHSTFESNQISAQQKINHHNKTLGSVFVRLMPTEQILSEYGGGRDLFSNTKT